MDIKQRIVTVLAALFLVGVLALLSVVLGWK